jgi:hypothetical protein
MPVITLEAKEKSLFKSKHVLLFKYYSTQNTKAKQSIQEQKQTIVRGIG